MKYVFKQKPVQLSEDKVLAKNEYGDIITHKDKLIVPTNKYDCSVYSFMNSKWQKHLGAIVKKDYSAPLFYSDKLIVKDNDFFEYLDLTDKEQFMKEYYRKLRESKCYPIVNRGKVWYDHLTAGQHTELNDWYEAWLDVTDTYTVPETPAWVNDKLTKIEMEELL